MGKNMTDGIISVIECGNGNVQLTLNNPPVNAFSVELVKELYNALSIIDKNNNFKFLTVLGNGDNFSAGADLKERTLMSDEEALEFLNKLNKCFDLIENLKIPTICIIRGAALGGGAELALCCDIIVADVEENEDSIKIGFPETTLGIIPGAGGTYRIYKKMNQGIAKYWIFSGKQFSLEEACKYGFVDHINNYTSDHHKIVNPILENSRTSLVAAKKSMNKCYLESDRKKQGLIELEGYKKTLESPEKKEALEKYKKK